MRDSWTQELHDFALYSSRTSTALVWQFVLVGPVQHQSSKEFPKLLHEKTAEWVFPWRSYAKIPRLHPGDWRG